MSASDGFSERPPLVDQLREVQDFQQREEPKRTNATSTVRRNQVYKGVKAVYVLAGKSATPFHPALGESIQEGAHDAAEAWDELAAQNPKVKAFILKFLQGTLAAKLVSVHLQMALPLLATSQAVPEKMRELAQALLMAQMAEKLNQMNTPPNGN